MQAHRTNQQARLHYAVAAAIIGIYGIQVCPFVESLSLWEVFLPILLIISLQYLARQLALSRLVLKAPYKHQVSRVFASEFGLFVTSGVLLSSCNTLLYNFPLESALKIIFGFVSLGYFISLDLALTYERHLAQYLESESIAINPDQKHFPLVKKFSLFATGAVTLFVGVFFLIINKDILWILQVNDVIMKPNIQRAVLGEFSFVGLILLGYMLVIIRSYSSNLNYFLSNENRVLGEVASGKLEGSVTVSSNDEFGVMAHRTNTMIRILYQRTDELQRTQDVTILSLASLAETRDNETGAHILRTQRYVRALAEVLHQHPRFRNFLDETTINLLYKSAPLHDIGKVGIPDAILLKPGQLDDGEFRIMKTHTTLGQEALAVAEKELGGSSFLTHAREIAESHHEKWDGSGYPKGLAKEQIPISGRLMAVADVYDALISKRVYKPAFPHEKAMEIILEGRGTHFDPDVVFALETAERQFKQIAIRYGDEHTS